MNLETPQAQKYGIMLTFCWEAYSLEDSFLPFAQVLREGKGQDTRPDKGQRVTIQVAGRTEDGTGVDWNSSLEFILGEGEVIQGIVYTYDATFILLTI